MARALAGFAIVTAGLVALLDCASAPKAPSPSPTHAVRPDPDTLRGPQIEGPLFDPRGVDFSDWLADFERKTHYNWLPPTYFGYGGAVEFVFIVETNGALSMVDMVTSSGTDALDGAARQALTRSRYEPLPQAFPRARVTMRVVFHYNPPPGS